MKERRKRTKEERRGEVQPEGVGFVLLQMHTKKKIEGVGGGGEKEGKLSAQ